MLIEFGPCLHFIIIMKDLTSNLPDEILCQVLGYIPSISERFKLAAMNRKFRRCIMTVLEQPMALEFRLAFNRGDERLNGCRVPLNDWPAALQVLAQKTQFKSIAWLGEYPPYFYKDELRTHGTHKRQFLETILKILIEADCLGQVVSFASSCLFYADEDVLCGFLAPCGKLTVLDVGESLTHCPGLAVALTNKALTELWLAPDSADWFRTQQGGLWELLRALVPHSLAPDWFHNDQSGLWELFAALVPHKLRKVHLRFCEIDGDWNLAELVRELAKSAWSGLEDVSICFPPETQVAPDMEQLFQALLSSLPMLRRCRIAMNFRRDPFTFNELVLTMLSVLNESDRATQLAVVYRDTSYYNRISTCAVIPLIQHLQLHHPSLQFDFSHDCNLIFVELGNVSLSLHVDYDCTGNAANCVNCHSFYPIVIDRLARLALTKTSAHLEDYQLDRCRVNRVPADIIKYYKRMEVPQVTEVNEGPDLVTFTFADAGDQFYISVASGQCFFNPCLGCLVID